MENIKKELKVKMLSFIDDMFETIDKVKAESVLGKPESKDKISDKELVLYCQEIAEKYDYYERVLLTHKDFVVNIEPFVNDHNNPSRVKVSNGQIYLNSDLKNWTVFGLTFALVWAAVKSESVKLRESPIITDKEADEIAIERIKMYLPNFNVKDAVSDMIKAIINSKNVDGLYKRERIVKMLNYAMPLCKNNDNRINTSEFDVFINEEQEQQKP